MEFYIGFLVVEAFLLKEYFQHNLTYVIAMRILTKEKIEFDDISSVFTLLNFFVIRFEKHIIGSYIHGTRGFANQIFINHRIGSFLESNKRDVS